MAEFIGQEKPESLKDDYGPDEGFNAFGKPVPIYRKQAAFAHCKAMGLTDFEEMWRCIETMSIKIERDEPYDAIGAGMVYLDLTGTYRLLAVLCTARKADVPADAPVPDAVALSAEESCPA